VAGPRLAICALAALAALASAAPLSAQRIVASPRPESVDVTVYRAPSRSASDPFRPQWLGGYALVSETRRIRLPEGESEIRFEGVAAGLIPQSVIVSGLPEDIVERNRDALLLSPGTLVDRSVGRRVHLRRTSLATGRTREHEAVIRTGADGGVVLETADGFESLRCTGLPETIAYERVPAGLSARPTLSVRARARREVSATVTLAYIASGFDWQANYVATLSEDGSRADLFAWLTLASNDETSFPNADVQAVAGHINRERVDPQEAEGPPLELRCWAHSTTSDIPLEEFTRTPLSRPLPPVAVPESSEAITVTGSRMQNRDLTSYAPLTVVSAMEAQMEALGDVKLYRIPEPVTVAANAQKQVALLQRAGVEVAIVNRHTLGAFQDGPLAPPDRMLVAQNRESGGLGIPLPGGPMLLFSQTAAGRPMLIGQGQLEDRAVGEEVEIFLGPASGVTAALKLPNRREGERDIVLTVTNDAPQPVRYEAEFRDALEIVTDEPLVRREGKRVWAVTVPANGTAVLRFRGER
jgi:hypothetical protein